MTECKTAFEMFKKEIQKDEDYAWTWHCNITMPFIDQGGTHEQANKAAANFMKIAFDVDITKSHYYQYKD